MSMEERREVVKVVVMWLLALLIYALTEFFVNEYNYSARKKKCLHNAFRVVSAHVPAGLSLHRTGCLQERSLHTY